MNSMKKGTSAAVVSQNVRDMMRSGKSQKHAIASALAMKRKYQNMANGGMVDDMDDDNHSIAELQIEGESHPDEVMNPEMQDKDQMMASMLHKKAEEEEMGYAMGGLVESEDTPLGNKPSEDMASKQEEPMPSMMSEDAIRALKEKKAKRRFS